MDDGSLSNVETIWALASQDALDRLTALARRQFDAALALTSYFSPALQHVASAAGAETMIGDRRRIERPQSLCRHVLERNAPLAIDDMERNRPAPALPCDAGQPIRAYLGVPIRGVGDAAIGTLCLLDHRPRAWSEDEIALLSELAGCIGAQITAKAATRAWHDAETELNRTQMRLSSMADNIPGVVFERRKTGPASWRYTVLGAAKSSVINAQALAAVDEGSPLSFVHPHDRARIGAAIEQATRDETDTDLTFRLADPSGATRWLRSQSVVRHDPDGTAVWEGLCFEISDLVAAREAAEAARRAKDTLLVDVNHELRAPLQAILGFAGLLKGETRLDMVQAHAATIEAAAQSLLSIVNQLLDLASDQTGGAAPISRTPTAVKALAETCHAMVAPLALEKGLGSYLSIDPDVPLLVLADELKIQQVLVNLLNNAVKFTEAGSIALQVSNRGGRLRFSVQDTGIGIAEDKRDQLFQRFSRIEPDGRAARGSGLGLAIAKQLVERMGGTIDVTSNPGAGTTFWFEIDAEPVEVAALESQELGDDGALRILIADDLDLNRRLIADMLSLDGYHIDCVEDGAAAVKAVRETRYDLILMDMIMPGMDGVAATRAIRALPAPACNVPIIALTAHSYKEQLDTCLAAGMDATLTKPMSMDALSAAVRSWTQGRSQAA